MNVFYLIICFLISLTLSLLILKFHEVKLKYYIRPSTGPQAIHNGNVSRLGGLSIFLTIALLSFVNFYDNFDQLDFFFSYFVIAVPVFILGFIEDITQKISPKLDYLAHWIMELLLFYF